MFLFLIIDFDKELIEYENKHELIARTKHFPGMNTYKCRYKLKQVRLYTYEQHDFDKKKFNPNSGLLISGQYSY